jgi:hypothetical protein
MLCVDVMVDRDRGAVNRWIVEREGEVNHPRSNFATSEEELFFQLIQDEQWMLSDTVRSFCLRPKIMEAGSLSLMRMR